MKRRKHHSTKALQPLHWAGIGLVNQNPASATKEAQVTDLSFIFLFSPPLLTFFSAFLQFSPSDWEYGSAADT